MSRSGKQPTQSVLESDRRSPDVQRRRGRSAPASKPRVCGTRESEWWQVGVWDEDVRPDMAAEFSGPVACWEVHGQA